MELGICETSRTLFLRSSTKSTLSFSQIFFVRSVAGARNAWSPSYGSKFCWMKSRTLISFCQRPDVNPCHAWFALARGGSVVSVLMALVLKLCRACRRSGFFQHERQQDGDCHAVQKVRKSDLVMLQLHLLGA